MCCELGASATGSVTAADVEAASAENEQMLLSVLCDCQSQAI